MQNEPLFWIGHAFGVVAMILMFMAFQNKQRTTVLLKQNTASGFFVVHFLLLSAYTGAAMRFLSIFRNYIFSKKESHAWASSRWWLYSFLAAMCLATYFIWEDWHSLLALGAMITGTIGAWSSNPARLRFLCMSGAFFWLPYTIITGTYPATIALISDLISWMIAIWRFDRHLYASFLRRGRESSKSR